MNLKVAELRAKYGNHVVLCLFPASRREDISFVLGLTDPDSFAEAEESRQNRGQAGREDAGGDEDGRDGGGTEVSDEKVRRDESIFAATDMPNTVYPSVEC